MAEILMDLCTSKRTDAGMAAMKRPMNPVYAAFKEFSAAKIGEFTNVESGSWLGNSVGQNVSTFTFWAATEKLIAITIDGNLDSGVKFIDQSQGLVNDIPTVDALINRVVQEAYGSRMKFAQKWST